VARAETEVAKERAGIPEPEPISRAGVRYEAIVWGRARGLPQNGGYVVAIDERTGAERWITRIYASGAGSDKEQDKQDVFITRLEFGAHPRHLRIVNERGDVYRLDLRTRAVTVLRRTR
jgi:hypothetical protein